MRFLPFLLLVALVACETETPADTPSTDTVAEPAEATSASGEVSVRDPFVSSAPAGGTGGVFFTLVGGAEADTLLAARYPGAERVEVHETYETEDGLRGMREIADGLAVPAGEEVGLVPGGYHVMLIRLTESLAEGDTVEVELEMAQAGTLSVQVPVLPLEEVRAMAAGADG
ncbi:MAG: copper chaperone PCu(A)C [Bacteroidota bacterium]